MLLLLLSAYGSTEGVIYVLDPACLYTMTSQMSAQTMRGVTTAVMERVDEGDALHTVRCLTTATVRSLEPTQTLECEHDA